MPDGIPAIASNLERVRGLVIRAAARASRCADEITLVAVSKTFPAATIRAAYEAGLRHFGENRVQEWEQKGRELPDLDATWHLIGRLQSNKVKRAARLFHVIDSVDSFELAQKLDHAVEESSSRSPLPILLEVRLAPEETKSGASESDLPRLAEAILEMRHLELRGLMAIPPYFEEAEKSRPYFRRLRELRDALRRQLSLVRHFERSEKPFLPELSMGMSHDFDVAIEEGATQIRLGAALFGLRSTRR